MPIFNFQIADCEIFLNEPNRVEAKSEEWSARAGNARKVKQESSHLSKRGIAVPFVEFHIIVTILK